MGMQLFTDFTAIEVLPLELSEYQVPIVSVGR